MLETALMPERYPAVEPYESGMLDVTDGHRLYWETCGVPDMFLSMLEEVKLGSESCRWWHLRTLRQSSSGGNAQ